MSKHRLSRTVERITPSALPWLVAGCIGIGFAGCMDSCSDVSQEDLPGIQFLVGAMANEDKLELVASDIEGPTLRFDFDGNEFDLDDSNLEAVLGFGSSPDEGMIPEIFEDLTGGVEFDLLDEQLQNVQTRLEEAFGSGGSVETMLNDKLIPKLTAKFPEGSEDECEGFKLDQVDKITFEIQSAAFAPTARGLGLTLVLGNPTVQVDQARIWLSGLWCGVPVLDDLTVTFPDARIEILIDFQFLTGFEPFDLPWPDGCAGAWFEHYYYPDGLPDEYYDIERGVSYSMVEVVQTITAEMGEPEITGVADDIMEQLATWIFTGLLSGLWNPIIPATVDVLPADFGSMAFSLGTLPLHADDWSWVIQDLHVVSGDSWWLSLDYIRDMDWDDDDLVVGLDNCPDDPNPDQADADMDGVGDVCDPEWSLPTAEGAPVPILIDAESYCDEPESTTPLETTGPDMVDPAVEEAQLQAAQDMFLEMRAELENLHFDWSWIVIDDGPMDEPLYLSFDEVIRSVGEDWLSPELWQDLNGLEGTGAMFVEFVHGGDAIMPESSLLVEDTTGTLVTAETMVGAVETDSSMVQPMTETQSDPVDQVNTDSAAPQAIQPTTTLTAAP